MKRFFLFFVLIFADLAFAGDYSVLSLKTNYLYQMPKGSVDGFVAVELRENWEAPISELRGDLFRFGVLKLDFFLSRYVWIKINGVAQEVLGFNNEKEYSFNYPGIQSTSAHDIGDFSIATIACVLPQGKHTPAVGFRIETKFPNTNQDRGLGPNTTDVILSILTTQDFGSFLAFGDFGAGILTAPRKLNEQNDVFTYGFGFIWKLKDKLQLAGEINGFLSTRHTIPIGTEDRGSLRCGLVWGSPGLSLELFPIYGLTKREGKFGMSIGLSWRLSHFIH